jgi:hypothetical protein
MHSATSINKLVIDPNDQKLLSKPMQIQKNCLINSLIRNFIL